MKNEVLKIMLRAKMSVKDAAQYIGVSKSYLYLILNGFEPSLDLKLRLSDLIGVSPFQIFKFSPEEISALEILKNQSSGECKPPLDQDQPR